MDFSCCHGNWQPWHGKWSPLVQNEPPTLRLLSLRRVKMDPLIQNKEFHGYECTDLLTNETKIWSDSQATCALMCLAFWHVIHGCLYNPALAGVWLTRAGVKVSTVSDYWAYSHCKAPLSSWCFINQLYTMKAKYMIEFPPFKFLSQP